MKWRRWSQGLLSGAKRIDKREQAQICWPLAQVAKRVYEVCSIQNLPGHRSDQPAAADLAVGLD